MATAGVLLLAGCTGAPAHSEKLPTKTTSPAAPVTVIADGDQAGMALKASQELFARAPVVVVAPEDDPTTQDLAARGAVALGVPLLLGAAGDPEASAAPSPGQNADLVAELARLDAKAVILVGGVARLPSDLKGSPKVIWVEATPSALGSAIGKPVSAPSTLGTADFAAEIAALTPGNGLSGEQDESGSPAPSAPADSAVPIVERAKPLDDTLALVVDAPGQLAAIATARAAGVAVHLIAAEDANPQASSSVIKTLHESKAAKIMAIGPAFGEQDDLDWKIRSARTGYELPGGGQLLFPSHLFVALYGTPGAPVMGVLGEQDADGAVKRAEAMADDYRKLTDKTVVPMFEIIATVASATAGRDGNYSTEIPPEKLRPWIDKAADEGIYVLLDLQPGRTDFLTQAKEYQELLELPNVGLALDPEWRLLPHQVHLVQIGSVTAKEINSVSSWLAELVNEKGLPPKMFVLHQFQLRMIKDRQDVVTTHPELATLIHVDGQGSQPAKQETWRVLHRDAPEGVAWGWKNFYDEDSPMLTPEQTMSQVKPEPDLVTYQ